MATRRLSHNKPLLFVLLLMSVLAFELLTSQRVGAMESTADSAMENESAIETAIHLSSADSPPSFVTQSWDGTSISFAISYRLSARYFDGYNIGIKLTASCPINGTFTISLYRNSSFVGSASVRRNGYSETVWTNVGPGCYSYYFSKSQDGATVLCSNIAMYSW